MCGTNFTTLLLTLYQTHFEMLKYLHFFLCLFFSILTATLCAQNGPIIAVRNVCVGTIVEVKTSDFTCTGITTVPGISGNTVDMPLFSSNPTRRSTSIQLNRIGTYFFFLACADNTSQQFCSLLSDRQE